MLPSPAWHRAGQVRLHVAHGMPGECLACHQPHGALLCQVPAAGVAGGGEKRTGDTRKSQLVTVAGGGDSSPSRDGRQRFPALPRKRWSTPALNSFISGSSAPAAPPRGRGDAGQPRSIPRQREHPAHRAGLPLRQPSLLSGTHRVTSPCPGAAARPRHNPRGVAPEASSPRGDRRGVGGAAEAVRHRG